jgi:hypothetical protein
MINVNSTEFWNQENVTNLSTGNGWNFGYVERKNGSFELFRYHTNGWQNTLDSSKVFKKETEFPCDYEEAEYLFFR